MDFIDQLKQFSKRVESLKDNIQTEEATKTSLIMPFFSLLGYDVFNPDEFIPEFTADVGIKKGEKVDYAILQDGKPVILIEAKWIGEKLEKHDSQLFRYFATCSTKFAILTNGQYYRFYTDLDEPNKMDETPFLDIDLLALKETQVVELKKFCKENFNEAAIFDAASELKYTYEFRKKFSDELQNPSDELVRFFLSSTYDGMKTANVIDHFRPVLKKALNGYISELMNDRIQSALNSDNQETSSPKAAPETEIQSEAEAPAASKIVTTEEEKEAYFIVKNLLKETVPPSDITYKDTASYFNILYQNNTWRWICRLKLSDSRKLLIIPDENKKEQIFPLDDLYDIEKYKDQLTEVLKRYMK